MSKDKCGYNLDDLVVDACESFDKDYGDMRMGYDDDDVIHEIADNSVPIYYWDIGQYASQIIEMSFWIAVYEQGDWQKSWTTTGY